jgi:hypothetical protein
MADCGPRPNLEPSDLVIRLCPPLFAIFCLAGTTHAGLPFRTASTAIIVGKEEFGGRGKVEILHAGAETATCCPCSAMSAGAHGLARDAAHRRHRAT